MFRAGTACEAVDCEGPWERATVVDIGVSKFLVHIMKIGTAGSIAVLRQRNSAENRGG